MLLIFEHEANWVSTVQGLFANRVTPQRKRAVTPSARRLSTIFIVLRHVYLVIKTDSSRQLYQLRISPNALSLAILGQHTQAQVEST